MIESRRKEETPGGNIPPGVFFVFGALRHPRAPSSGLAHCISDPRVSQCSLSKMKKSMPRCGIMIVAIFMSLSPQSMPSGLLIIAPAFS